MATAAAPISIEEYFQTEYEPDCEYLAGKLEDRNVGKRKHSRTQALIAQWFLAREENHRYQILIEQRVQFSSQIVRIPDICLVPPEENAEVLCHPPLLWVEILSPEDRWSRIQKKIADVLAFGVPMIWIVDPYTQEGWTATSILGVQPAAEGILRSSQPALEFNLNEIWQRL